MGIDAIRAGGNWLVSSEIEDLENSLDNAEVAARKAITVVEDEI